jgi:hypothetical protein
VRRDRIVFFANGDFQTTGQYDDPSRTVVGNVASIYYGLADSTKILVRRQTILTKDEDPGLDDFSATRGFKSEYYKISLAEWRVDPPAPLTSRDFTQWDEWVKSPTLVSTDEDDLVMYVAKGVDDFAIQYVGPDNLGMGNEFNEWYPDNNDVDVLNKKLTGGSGIAAIACKFSFRLYDSKRIIKGGRTFSHIIWLEQRH